VYDFACQIAAGEIFPSLAFGFEPLHPTVLIRNSPMPECAKRAIRCAVYSVTLDIDFGNHDATPFL
jgi:hypothetical protein